MLRSSTAAPAAELAALRSMPDDDSSSDNSSSDTSSQEAAEPVAFSSHDDGGATAQRATDDDPSSDNSSSDNSSQEAVEPVAFSSHDDGGATAQRATRGGEAGRCPDEKPHFGDACSLGAEVYCHYDLHACPGFDEQMPTAIAECVEGRWVVLVAEVYCPQTAPAPMPVSSPAIIEIGRVGEDCPAGFEPMERSECEAGATIGGIAHAYGGGGYCGAHWPDEGCFRYGNKLYFSTCRGKSRTTAHHYGLCTKAAAPVPTPAPSSVIVEIGRVGEDCPAGFEPLGRSECEAGATIGGIAHAYGGGGYCGAHWPNEGCFRYGNKLYFSTCRGKSRTTAHHYGLCTKAAAPVPTSGPTHGTTPSGARRCRAWSRGCTGTRKRR